MRHKFILTCTMKLMIEYFLLFYIRKIYYNKDCRVFIYLFRVTLSVISTGENSCPPYCGHRFKYLRK